MNYFNLNHIKPRNRELLCSLQQPLNSGRNVPSPALNPPNLSSHRKTLLNQSFQSNDKNELSHDPPNELCTQRSQSLIPIIVTHGEWVGAKDSLIQPSSEVSASFQRKVSLVK